MALQLVAIPLAARAVGTQEFAVYLVVASVLGFVTMANLGQGPGVTRRLLAASAAGDKRLAKAIVTSGLAQLAAFAVVIVLVASVYLAYFPAHLLFGPKFASHESSIRSTVIAGLLLATISCLLSAVDAVLAANLQIHRANAASCVGYLLSALVLPFVTSSAPSAQAVIICVYGVPLLPRLANALFVARTTPEAIPDLRAFSPTCFWQLLRDNACYSVVQLCVLVANSVAIVIVGRLLGPTSVSQVGVLVQLNLLLGTAVVMLVAPTWPALADARSNGDWLWARRAATRLWLFGGLIAIAFGAAVAIGGQTFVRHLYGVAFTASRSTVVYMGVYFALNTIETVAYHVALAAEADIPATMLFLAKASLILLLSAAGLQVLGVSGYPATLITATIATTASVLPFVAWRAYRSSPSFSRQEPQPATGVECA